MKTFLVIVCCIFYGLNYAAVPLPPLMNSLEDAQKRGLLELKITSNGGFSGKSVKMFLRNRSATTLRLRIEAGQKLNSKQDSQQDLLITKSEDIILASHATKKISLYAMCCQAHRSSPSENAIYTLDKNSDILLSKLAKFIDSTGYYDKGISQQAIWMLSDDKPFASVCSQNSEEEDLMRGFLSKLTGKALPKYNVFYGNGRPSDVMGNATRVTGVFNYAVSVNGKASIILVNEAGIAQRVFFQNLVHTKGDCKLYYTMNTYKMISGKYFIRFMEGNEITKEEVIEI